MPGKNEKISPQMVVKMVMNPMVESVKTSPKKHVKGYDIILNSLYW